MTSIMCLSVCLKRTASACKQKSEVKAACMALICLVLSKSAGCHSVLVLMSQQMSNSGQRCNSWATKNLDGNQDTFLSRVCM